MLFPYQTARRFPEGEVVIEWIEPPIREIKLFFWLYKCHKTITPSNPPESKNASSWVKVRAPTGPECQCYTVLIGIVVKFLQLWILPLISLVTIQSSCFEMIRVLILAFSLISKTSPVSILIVCTDHFVENEKYLPLTSLHATYQAFFKWGWET